MFYCRYDLLCKSASDASQALMPHKSGHQASLDITVERTVAYCLVGANTCAWCVGPVAVSLHVHVVSDRVFVLTIHCMCPLPTAMAFIRCRISFALLRSCIACLRGSQVRHRAAANEVSHTLAVSEALISRD